MAFQEINSRLTRLLVLLLSSHQAFHIVGQKNIRHLFVFLQVSSQRCSFTTNMSEEKPSICTHSYTTHALLLNIHKTCKGSKVLYLIFVRILPSGCLVITNIWTHISGHFSFEKFCMSRGYTQLLKPFKYNYIIS